METSLLNQWFSGHQIDAICWTLIHSLWIGMIIALLCGLVILCTRRSAAVLRYRLLCSLLMVFVCAIGVTYYLESASATVVEATDNTRIAATPVNVHQNVMLNHAAVSSNQTLISSVQALLNQNINIIFMVWLLFFVMKSLKMVSGLLYIQRIRTYKTHAVTDELKNRIEQFSSQIGIRRAVRLVQSELVKVPVAIGWLKPMILLPFGIAFQLTPEQLDGILWHELAHIRRRDYLVNILQGLVETVFFFNPGLLWLSSLIRTEREACCDDMVLCRMSQKANYLEALLSFGYGEFKQAGYAMSIGSGNQLRDRMRRMISQENKRLSVAEKTVLTVGLVLLSAFTTISKDNPVMRRLTITFRNKSGKVVTKTMPVNMHRLPQGQRVDDLKPNSREKHAINLTDTAIRFTSVLFKSSDADLANNDLRAMDDKGNKYHFIVANNKLVAMEMNGTKIADNKLADYDYMIRNIDRELATKRRIRAEDIAAFKANSPGVKFKSDVSVERSLDSLKKAYKKTSSDSKTIAMSDVDRLRLKLEAMRDRNIKDSINFVRQQQRADNVIADLVKEKIVANAAAVKWFGLNDTEFIVNGQKQPDAMQQKYKAKYGVHKDYGLYYGPVKMYGTGVFIDGPARPARPVGPRPKYMGAAWPASRDSISWKQQQLVMQQRLFEAEQNGKRSQLMLQQQLFAANQEGKRQQLLLQQKLKLAEQAGILQQQQDAQLLKWKSGKDQNYSPKVSIPDVIANVTDDLVIANVVKDKSELIKFNLSNSALLVNGKKQPEDLHQKLKAKYLQQPDYLTKLGIADDPNFGLHFNAQNGAMGLGITMGPDSP